MTRLRSLLHARRWLALLVVVAALAVRMVVPAGMMPGAGRDGPALVICSGHAMPGMATGKADPPAPARGDAPCAYTGLLAAAIDGPALPALAPPPPPALVVAAPAFATVALRPTRLWPPLRGPPGPRAV